MRRGRDKGSDECDEEADLLQELGGSTSQAVPLLFGFVVGILAGFPFDPLYKSETFHLLSLLDLFSRYSGRVTEFNPLNVGRF